MVRMKEKKVTVLDDISGKTYTGVPLMDEDPKSTRVLLDCGNVKLNFDIGDESVIELEE
jgi:hypothetical protein